jgi:hypothetical protein
MSSRDIPQRRDFCWQESYGAFSVGIGQVEDAVRYIDTQEEHHQQRTFQRRAGCVLAAARDRIRSSICVGLMARGRISRPCVGWNGEMRALEPSDESLGYCREEMPVGVDL